MKWPIAEVNRNKLIDISGQVSYMWKVGPPDLEQFSPTETDNFYNGIEASLEQLSSDEWLKFYSINGASFLNSSYENIKINGVELKEKERPLEVLFDKSLYTDVVLLEDKVRFNQKSISILSAESFGDLNSILEGVDYVLCIRRIDSKKANQRLENIRSAQSLSFSKLKKDISGESSYFQAEELLEDVIHGRESLFEMEMYFLCDDDAHEVKSELSLIGIETYLEGRDLIKCKAGLADSLLTIIPGVAPSFKSRSIPNKTSHLKYLLPLSDSKLMESGIRLLDINDDPIFLDPFDSSLKNRNMLVTGLSGAGKSVFVNKLVNYLAPKHPIVILDKGGSFKRTAIYHDGNVLNGSFNAFQFRDPLYLRELILSVVDKEKFCKLERGRLLKEIKENAGKCKSFKELIATLESTFPDISFYFEEVIDSLCGEELGVSDFLYIDIENYPKGIVSPLIIYILEYFKSLRGEKVLVFDEVWSLIKGHGSYIDECFRTFRKSGAFPVAISQSLKDFDLVDSELKGSITNNSYFKVFFPQELEETCDIDSFDIKNAKELQYSKGEYSECYLKSSDNKYRKTLRICLNALEYELFHTESGEDKHFLDFLSNFRSYFSSNKETINAFIRLKYETDTNDISFFNELSSSKGEHPIYAR